jgi:hypothetical protein
VTTDLNTPDWRTASDAGARAASSPLVSRWMVRTRAAHASGLLRRAVAWWRRWRLDGRLPQPTVELVAGRVRFGLLRPLQEIVARVLPARGVGISQWDGRGWRRYAIAGTLDRPRYELPVEHAAQVAATLERAGLAPFLVDADDGGVHLGLPAEDRRRAAAALATLGPQWFVRWRRGHRRHVGTLASPLTRARARQAESWRLFRVHRIGDRQTTGVEDAVLLSFWGPGPGGRRERLGYRGLHRFGPEVDWSREEVGGHEFRGIVGFPVRNRLGTTYPPIDVVYTWVDGDDPEWRRSFETWRAHDRADRRDDHATHPSRYASHDELRYSLRSLWLNAGWVRRIYIVTADQRPPWLVEDDRLRVVSHAEIFPADALPTFNSHAIEARLHHIGGLAEHFIYFNDDVMVGRPLRPSAFVTPNGLSRFFESEARVPPPTAGTADLAVDTAARIGQALIRDRFGLVPAFKMHHAPHALRRSVLFDLEAEFDEVVKRTVYSRFRHPQDVSIASAFAHHFGFCTGRAVPGSLRVGYQNLGSRRLGMWLRRLELARDYDVFCVNETERWETDPELADRQFRQFLANYFPLPSPWEATPDPGETR